MELRQLGLVLPWEGPDGFSSSTPEPTAQAVLHAWTALWRPELLAAAGVLPRFWSPKSLPEPQDGLLLVVPTPSQAGRWRRWCDALSPDEQQVWVIEGLDDRSQIAAKLAGCGLPLVESGDAWAAEFFALGYACWQVDCLTGGISEPSLISLEDLRSKVVTAAQAALSGDSAAANHHLRLAYDLLEQLRDHNYPLATYLVDLALLGPAIGPTRLQRELAETSAKTFVLPASYAPVVEQSKELAQQFRQASVAVTHQGDPPLASRSPDQVRQTISNAVKAAVQLTGQPPQAFVQTEQGLSPQLADELLAKDALPVVLAPFDGRLQEFDQASFPLWTWSGASVPALAARPRSAALASTLLLHARRMSEGLSLHGVSVEIFAGWAGCQHELWGDLRRVASRSRVLGTLVSLQEFFDQTESHSAPQSPEIDDYGPALRQAFSPLAPEPIVPESTLCQLAEILSGGPCAQQPTATPAERLAALLAHSDAQGEQVLVLNTHSYPRAVLVDPLQQARPVDWPTAHFVPNVPALGYRVSSPCTTPITKQRASETELQNERLHVQLDAQHGGIRSVRQHGERSNRLSQRLSVRRGSKRIATPVRMEVAESQFTNLADRGIVQTSGELFDLKGGKIGEFHRTLALFAEWDRLLVEIQWDTQHASTALDQLMLCCQLALPYGRHSTFRGVGWRKLPTNLAQFAVSDYVHWTQDQRSLTVATSGPCACYSAGEKCYDLVLPLSDSGTPTTRIAIALDEPQPLRVALDLAAQSQTGSLATVSATPSSGWLAHVDAANVLVAGMERVGSKSMDLKLCETAGRFTSANIRFAQACHQAQWYPATVGRDDPEVQPAGEVRISLQAYESRTLRVTW